MRSQIATLTQVNQKLLRITETFADTNPAEFSRVQKYARTSRAITPVIVTQPQSRDLFKQPLQMRCAHFDTMEDHHTQDESEQGYDNSAEGNGLAMGSLSNSNYQFQGANDALTVCDPTKDCTQQLTRADSQPDTPTSTGPVPTEFVTTFPQLLATPHPSLMDDDSTQYLSRFNLTAPPNACNSIGEMDCSALHDAVRSGRVTVVETLIACGMDVNVQDKNGNTPLHYTAMCNNAVMALLLLDRGCYPYVENNEGFTALALSAEMKHTDITTKLIQCGVLR